MAAMHSWNKFSEMRSNGKAITRQECINTEYITLWKDSVSCGVYNQSSCYQTKHIFYCIDILH